VGGWVRAHTTKKSIIPNNAEKEIERESARAREREREREERERERGERERRERERLDATRFRRVDTSYQVV
jgi:hypothetical protein